jgi:2',3'-cyclic-nucleotide 2'-phosphodiesterase (5'-nucleotidase family)
MKKSWILVLAVILVFFSACEKGTGSTIPEGEIKQDSLIEITILYTNDEHGWFQQINGNDGGAGLVSLWKNKEAYDGADNFLILSGGDMWTGAAASTWFQGKSMVEVMNAMEYDATAIGNHEFDFTIDILNERLGEMDFPILAANLTNKNTGEFPDFVKPYIIKEIDGIKIGIIGLASRSTPYTTFPGNIEDFEFTDYTEALNNYAPKALREGANFLILISHLCEYELKEISKVAYTNKICVMGGGHCHEEIVKKYNEVVVIGSGHGMSAYTKVDFNYNVTKGHTQDFEFNLVHNNQGVLDSELKEVVDYWNEQTNNVLSEVIGYASTEIARSSDEMWNMVCDSWLYTFPNVDVTITNRGGIRQDIFAEDITMETMVGLLPFENTLYELELTGEQLIECIDGFIVGGMTTIDGYFLSDGTPIDNQKLYTVLTTDYLYSQTNINLSVYDDDPYDTGVHYRQPLIDWIKSLNTSSSNPLNNYLDSTPRHKNKKSWN